MSRYEQRGHIDVEDVDGGSLRIIYFNKDDERTADIVQAEVAVLRDFAAAYTDCSPDITGILPSRSERPCEIILVKSSMHNSTAEGRQNIEVEVATKAMFEAPARKTRAGIHVYSKNNDLAQGYEEWQRQGRGQATIYTSREAVLDLYDALDNDFGNEPPSSPPAERKGKTSPSSEDLP